MSDPNIRGSDPKSPSHMFPVRRIGPFRMSVQGDAPNRACSPKAMLNDIRSYDTVEVEISGPGGMIEVQRHDFPPEVRRLFPEGGGHKARYVTHEGVALIAAHLQKMANDLDITHNHERDESREPVALSNSGLREILLKLDEAVSNDTGEVNDNLISAISDLLQSARDRGISFDGLGAVESLTSSSPRP